MKFIEFLLLTISIILFNFTLLSSTIKIKIFEHQKKENKINFIGEYIYILLFSITYSLYITYF